MRVLFMLLVTISSFSALAAEPAPGFHLAVFLADIGPGGEDEIPSNTEYQKGQLDMQAALHCQALWGTSHRATEYTIEFGHTNHYTVTANLAANYICEFPN